MRWWKGGPTAIRVRFIADCVAGTTIILSPRVGQTVLVIHAELIFVAVWAYEAVVAASPRNLRILSKWLKIHTPRHVTYGIWGTCCGLIQQAHGSVWENNTHAEVGRICADNAGLTSGICSGRCGKKYHKQHLWNQKHTRKIVGSDTNKQVCQGIVNT